jgi:hypothetical protein
MLRIPHCLDNGLRDGCKVVSLRTGRRVTPQKQYLLFQMLSKPHGLVWPEGLGKLITFNYFTGARISDFPTCSTLPRPLRYCAPPSNIPPSKNRLNFQDNVFRSIEFEKTECNLDLSFPDVSLSWIHLSISVVSEQIIFKLWLQNLLFSRIHISSSGTPHEENDELGFHCISYVFPPMFSVCTVFSSERTPLFAPQICKFFEHA